MGDETNSPERPPIEVSEMTEEDVESVLAIERSAFPAPWSEGMFRQELHFFRSRSLKARVGGREIAGYLTCWIVAGEIHLHNLAVKESQRRRGVASALLREMMKRARRENALQITLEVRPSNEGARRLYEKFGFEVVGIRPLYYDDTKEDALIMWADLEK